VEEFNYLGSMITNDPRCTREIKARIVMAKAAFNKKKTLFTSKLDLEHILQAYNCEDFDLIYCNIYIIF
jgi:hypothetical protein